MDLFVGAGHKAFDSSRRYGLGTFEEVRLPSSSTVNVETNHSSSVLESSI